MKVKPATKIPYGHQSISDADVQAVVEVLRSDWLTQGPSIAQFEQAVADYCGARFGVAVANATAALHIACMALDLGPGDWLWTSPNTFVASANCARYCGAQVDFVDVDPRTYNMSIDALVEKLVEAKKTNRLPKVLVPVHFAGQSCDMEAIAKLAKEYGFRVIEDASHAVGGRYKGKSVGNCQFSDITVFSFHPVKIITTGEGGLCATNDPALKERLARLRSHGTTRDPGAMVSPSEGGWYYQQIELGYNYRLTDLQAVLGLSQLKRIDDFVAARHQKVQRYHRELSGLPLVLPYEHPDCYSAYHLYVIQVKPAARLNRAELYDKLQSLGIGVNVHYIPVHLQPYYRQLGFGPGDFPEAEGYYQQALSLPLFADLGDDEQSYVIDSLKELLQ